MVKTVYQLYLLNTLGTSSFSYFPIACVSGKSFNISIMYYCKSLYHACFTHYNHSPYC